MSRAFRCGCVVVVCCSLWGASLQAREPIPEAALQRYVARFDAELQRSLERVARSTEAQRPLPWGVEHEAAAHRGYLEALRSEARRLDEPRRTILLDKLRHLEGLVYNLELVVERGDGQGMLPSLALEGSGSGGSGLTSQTSASPTDACQNAPTVGEGLFFGDTGTASQDGEASCGSSLFSPDVWFRFVAPRADTFFVDTVGSDFDTVISVHTACPGTLQNEVVCNDDTFGTASLVSFFASQGQVRWIRVSGFGGATGQLTLRVGAEGGIRGRVTHAQTGEPISGASVFVLNDQGLSLGSRLTGPDGVYEFLGLLPGSYFAVAAATAFQTELYEELSCLGGRFSCDIDEGTLISVLSEGVVENVDFTLFPGGSITGHVREAATGLGIANASVRIFDEFGSFQRSAFTDPTGFYEASGLRSGRRHAVADSPEHGPELYEELPCSASCIEQSGTPIQVELGETMPGIDFTLERLGGFQGRVTDALTNSPLEGFFIDVFDERGFSAGFAISDFSGEYLVEGLPVGRFFAVVSGSGYAAELYRDLPCGARFPSCTVTGGTPIEVTADSVTEGIHFTPNPLGSISGMVSDASTGDPVSFIDAELYTSQGSFLDSGFVSGAGEFLFPDLLPGSYFARTEDFSGRFVDELYDNFRCEPSCDVTSGTPIEIGVGQDVSGIDFALRQQGAISGRVTDAQTGQPLTSTLVRVFDAQGFLVRSAFTAGEGRFEVFGLPTGTYFARTFIIDTHRDELYDDMPCEAGCGVTSGTPIQTLEGQATTGIDFALDRLGEVAGTVVDATTGEPIGGIDVQAFDVNGSFVGSVTSTSSSGEYSLVGLPTGTYLLRARDLFRRRFASELYREKPCELNCSVLDGDPVSVEEGLTTSGIDFTLDPRGIIRGRVMAGENGVGLADVRIEFLDASGFLEGIEFTNAVGEYRVQGLGQTTHFVVARPPSGSTRVAEVYNEIPCLIGSCDPDRDGTPIEVPATGEVTGIDFVLDEPSSLTVQVFEETTESTLSGVSVHLFNVRGRQLVLTATNDTGTARFEGLGAGSYFLSTSNSLGLLDELYDDLPCVDGGASCSVTKGTPIQVPAATDVAGIEIRLGPQSSGITGVARNSRTRAPVTSGAIHAWDELGNLAATDTLGSGGGYSFSLPPGTYFVSTDHGRSELFEEVFDNVRCENGSAVDGLCDPKAGTPVLVGDRLDPFAVVDFLLEERVPSLFSDGFESGDLSGWSRVVGSPPP